MKDLELKGRGKASFGALCAICCGLPMLVVLGVVSVGAALAIGASIASASAVVVTAYLVAVRRLMYVPAMARRFLAAGGAGLSGLGLWLASESNEAAPAVLSIAMAALATAALLAAAESEAAATITAV